MSKKMKGKIEVSPTGTLIHPYKKGQSYYMESSTSVIDYPNVHRRKPITGFLLPPDGVYYEEGIFVTHRNDPVFMKQNFPDYEIVNLEPSDQYQLSHKISLNDDVTPREVQYQVIQGIINNENKKQWFVYLSQGLGKTLLSVYMIAHFNVKALIMCFNKDILMQWVKTMREKTNIMEDKILLINSSKLLHSILYENFPFWEYDIFMCTPKLLVSFAKKYNWCILDELMDTLGIGLKIFDEAHRNIANIIKINALTRVDKTLYLSGDFAQSNKRIQELYYRIFHNVPVLKPTDELMETLKFTVAVVVFFNSEPSELDKTSVYSRRGFSFYEYMKYQMSKSNLYETLRFVLNGIRDTNKGGYKILILVNLIQHVEDLADTLKDEYDSVYNIKTYHSQKTEEERQDCRENGTMIISTYQSFREGLDVSLIKYVISCSICTKIDDNQASGRARPLPDGSEAFYFMLSDLGFDYTMKKLRERLTYLQQTKIKRIEKIYAD